MTGPETREGDAVMGTCNVCGQTVATQGDLSKHLADAHEGEEPRSGSP